MAYCTWHSGMETRLSCGSCGRPICPKCMVQHPVGIRCRQCARLRRLPVFQVTPWYYARAVLVALVLSTFGGFALFILRQLEVATPMGLILFYFRLLVLVGIGYVMGEGVSIVVNRKRGRGLQVVAAAGVGVSVLLSLVLGDISLPRTIFFSVLALGIAIFVATSRVGT